MAKAKTPAGRPPEQKQLTPRPRTKALSQDCRCKCSGVCTITGAAAVKAGDPRRYEVEVVFSRNKGCKPATSECEHTATAWSKSGQRAGAVTLEDQTKDSVTVRVAAGTAAGSFSLRAQPTVICHCKGTNASRECTMQFDEVTITVEV